MSNLRIRFEANGFMISLDVSADPPLGWRFWTLAGFPNDPIDPRPYGGSRCIILGPVSIAEHHYFACAMELDETVQLFTAHMLFPCTDQHGVETFAARILRALAVAPKLL